MAVRLIKRLRRINLNNKKIEYGTLIRKRTPIQIRKNTRKREI